MTIESAPQEETKLLITHIQHHRVFKITKQKLTCIKG
jgi:hypothetical protein